MPKRYQATARIPSLAFGMDRCIEFDDAERLAEALGPKGRASLVYRPVDHKMPFCSRSASVKTAYARIVASASSAVDVEAEGASLTGVLLLPIFGTTLTQYGRHSVEWGHGTNAAFLPPDRCTARTTLRSVVSVDIDPAAIEPVLNGILGDDCRKETCHFIDFTTPRPLTTHVRGVDFLKVILSYLSVLDSMNLEPDLIERSGIDNIILRSALLMMHPELISAREERRNDRLNAIGSVCDYIDANLNNRITLTDLELISGLSGRRLQYAFRARFDCTPMQWVAQRRLEAVRAHILAARPGASITAIASLYFTNLGDFARLYRVRYGELPSQTLRGALAKRH
ncbi:helix-turn-helix domain-containing protein [Ancylobacter sp.]|uniref:AraC family transcriptional regulator n=1 Tax=Ancylobacter sp. TaxID=1872567 RepID=UPI003D0E37C1